MDLDSFLARFGIDVCELSQKELNMRVKIYYNDIEVLLEDVLFDYNENTINLILIES